jgi:tetratricopeptide (TPR) repeat protein
MQMAQRAMQSRRYAEAVRALDSVDSASLLHDEAARRRREVAPRAAADDLDEARRLQQEDPDTAKARLQQALQLDPGNGEARALALKMHVELPPPPANTVVAMPLVEKPAPTPAPMKETPAPPPPAKETKAAKEAKPVAQKEPKAVAAKEPPAPKEPREKKAPPRVLTPKDDDDFAPVKVTKSSGKEPAAAQGKMDAAITSAPALAAYKAKDFAGAERFYRLDARNQQGKQMDKTIAIANQVRDLKAAFDRATADETKNPSSAIKDYEEAMAIDTRVGKGMHTPFFKQKIGKLQLPVAQQAYAAGKFDVAYNAVQVATKMGAGDGGLMKQLEAKAKELTDRGVTVQKANPQQAKQLWRQVIKMVPTSSPNYARAYQLINSASSGHRDEDED